MVIETVLVPAATGVVGVALGLGASLVLRHKARPIPQAVEKSVWEQLRELTRERAEAVAKKKALHRAYAAGSVNEHSFVTKDAHYTKLVEELDKEIDTEVLELSKAFLPEEMQKGENKLSELSDLAVLSKKLEGLKHDKRELDEERGQLYLQLTEAEEDKKMHLADKNKLQERYGADSKRLDEMGASIAQLEKHRSELEKKVAGIQPRDKKIAALERENRTLRDGLRNARDKIFTGEKERGILSTIIDRHAKEIDEARKTEELKSLIQPDNPGVRNLVKKLKTPEEAFEYVRTKIVEVHPQVSASYWLGVDDVMRLGAADPDDKAILLCSLLRAMDKDAWVAVLEMKNGYNRAVVVMDDHVLDPDEARDYSDFSGFSSEEAIRKYRFDGFPVKRLLYRFNEATYTPGD
ncbi:MAG: hypothetical protein KAW41_02280 [Candidatus Diapherotrites archaeon]|nr:hypothetical protein [Candidatus Diapherotrites archaeon]